MQRSDSLTTDFIFQLDNALVSLGNNTHPTSPAGVGKIPLCSSGGRSMCQVIFRIRSHIHITRCDRLLACSTWKHSLVYETQGDTCAVGQKLKVLSVVNHNIMYVVNYYTTVQKYKTRASLYNSCSKWMLSTVPNCSNYEDWS